MMRIDSSRFLAPVATLVLVLLGGLLTGCEIPATPAAASTAQPGTPVVVAEVQRADLTRELTYSADLMADASVKVYSPVTDRIEEFPFDDGDEVTRGQRLAVVRSDGLDRGLAQIAAQIDGLEAQVEQAEAELGRSDALRARGVITEQAYDQASTAHRAAVAQLEASRASFDQLSITAADASVEAPIDGVIADRMLQRGDMASAQVPLCTVMDLDPIRLELQVTEADLAHVRVGQDVTLAVDAVAGRTFVGEVVRVLPYLDSATRTNTVEVRVPNPVDEAAGVRLLKPGMYGRARLEVERLADVVVAPEGALMLDSGLLAAQEGDRELRRAYVVDDEGFARGRTVETGLVDRGLVAVRSGLGEGDRLVVRGQHQLDDGERVRVVDGGGAR